MFFSLMIVICNLLSSLGQNFTPMLIDINLDGAKELLMIASSRERSELALFGWAGGRPRVAWIDLGLDDAFMVTPLWRVNVYPVADSLGRTYMAVHTPDRGGDVYVGGLVVVRWNDWKPEILIRVDDVCPVLPWEVDAQGALVIPLTSPFPWQGCTLRRSGEVVIADAGFSR